MNMVKFSPATRLIHKAALICLLTAATCAHAVNIFWTGPTFTNVHASFSPAVDKLTTNHVADAANNVWLTRGTTQPLYNAAAESAWNGSGPANTLWVLASGNLTNAASLTYGSFASVVGAPGHSPGLSVGKTFFVKIVSDNIYLQLKLTAWGNNNGGSFTYERSTPAVALPPPPTPVISLTNPASGTVFAAPANVSIGANATVSSGTVTNVQLFTNNVPFLSLQTPPFLFTANNLATGAYALTAAATAGGISATSAAVNVSVITPVTVSLGGTVKTSATNFQFSYPANVGLTYVIERATSLAPTNWVRLATNMAASNPVVFKDVTLPNNPAFYRVGRLPNP